MISPAKFSDRVTKSTIKKISALGLVKKKTDVMMHEIAEAK